MEKKITVVIPNYNGAKILAKNLPSVIANCPNSPIIVVDDASQDNSVTLLHKKFTKIRVIRLKKNRGFSEATNLGVKACRTELVLLLNSDVSPRKGFLKPALRYLLKNKNSFAVGLCDYSHETGRIISRGRGGGYFRKGFLNHYAAAIERGETLWTSGGSSLIKRERFLKLGGFDEIYKPFYWEDIDLGFRAARLGFTSYFEPLSKVDHYHSEGAIMKHKSARYVKSISYKNQFIFVWKNIYDYSLVFEHIIFLPYHILKAIFRMDSSFFVGLAMALSQLPRLIFLENLRINNYPISEKAIFKPYEQ